MHERLTDEVAPGNVGQLKESTGSSEVFSHQGADWSTQGRSNSEVTKSISRDTSTAETDSYYTRAPEDIGELTLMIGCKKEDMNCLFQISVLDYFCSIGSPEQTSSSSSKSGHQLKAVIGDTNEIIDTGNGLKIKDSIGMDN